MKTKIYAILLAILLGTCTAMASDLEKRLETETPADEAAPLPTKSLAAGVSIPSVGTCPPEARISCMSFAVYIFFMIIK